jgi:hypothetical protein
MYPESLFEGDTLPEEPSFSPPVFDATLNDYSVSDGDSHVTENTGPSCQSRAPLQAEGVTPVEHPVTAGTSQRGRVRTMSQRMAKSIAQGLHHVAHESITGETNEDLFHDSHLELQERMRNPITFHMGDIMYLNQALQQSDAKEFIQALIKEVNGHVDCNNWMLKKRSKVPDEAQIVPSVWSMRHKRNLTTNQVKSHKTRLNLHGKKQIYGMNYFKTFAPVVTWFAVRLMIIFGIILDGTFARLTLLWPILRLQSRWTSTWNFHKGL